MKMRTDPHKMRPEQSAHGTVLNLDKTTLQGLFLLQIQYTRTTQAIK